jgi:hypothetical protein
MASGKWRWKGGRLPMVAFPGLSSELTCKIELRFSSGDGSRRRQKEERWRTCHRSRGDAVLPPNHWHWTGTVVDSSPKGGAPNYGPGVDVCGGHQRVEVMMEGVYGLFAEDLCCPRRFLRSQRYQSSFGSPPFPPNPNPPSQATDETLSRWVGKRADGAILGDSGRIRR